MRTLDLFAGIGGISLGLEKAGFRTVAFCEIQPYCHEVLRKNFPGVPIYDDVTTLTADTLARDGIEIDAICGGFPCQDLSFAGKRAGLEGARSGLWGEYRRLISEIRPRFVIVENVPGLLSLGMGTVLGDLAALGYDAVWDCVPAAAVGAPHRRDRVWVIAYSQSGVRQRGESGGQGHAAQLREDVAYAPRIQQGRPVKRPKRKRIGQGGQPIPENVADARGGRRPGPGLHEDAIDPAARAAGQAVEPVDGGGPGQRVAQRGLGGMVDGFPDRLDQHPWIQEPEETPRVIKGQENRANRLKALGNAVVPQVMWYWGQAIMRAISKEQG